MNQDKAREFFSAYYEETLEAGLRQTLDQRLRADAQLQAEYRGFVRTMESLDQLKFEEIEVPYYLSDRIATKISTVQDASRSGSRLQLWIPRFTVGAVAAAAILGAVGAWFQKSNVVTGDFIPVPTPAKGWPSENLGVEQTNGVVMLRYKSATARTVQILNTTGDVALNSISLDAQQSMATALNNSQPDAYLFQIKVSEGGPSEFVAVPGYKAAPSTTNSTGTLADFARAFAGRYKTPVVLNTPDTGKTITWSFDGTDGKAAADKALDGSSYDVNVTATGVVSISSR